MTEVDSRKEDEGNNYGTMQNSGSGEIDTPAKNPLIGFVSIGEGDARAEVTSSPTQDYARIMQASAPFEPPSTLRDGIVWEQQQQPGNYNLLDILKNKQEEIASNRGTEPVNERGGNFEMVVNKPALDVSDIRVTPI